MKSKDFNISNLGKFFFDFEGAKFEELSAINISGYNAWRAIKTPVFFHLLNPKPFKRIRIFSRANVIILLKGVIQLLKLFPYLIYLRYKKGWKSNPVIYLTLSANKTISENGVYRDKVVDEIIIQSGRPFYYIELIEGHRRDRLPSKFKSDLVSNQFAELVYSAQIILFVIGKFKEKGLKLYRIINHYNSDTPIQPEHVEYYLCSFHSNFTFYKFLFKILGPSSLVFNDQYATGQMAAAKSLGLKSVEIQHGLMDEYYPQYHLHPSFKRIRNVLPISDFIAVWGTFHKNQLLMKGFFEEPEIIITGKYDLFNISEKRFSEKESFLFISQGALYHDQFLKHLSELLKLPEFKDYYYVIKLHPLEPISHYQKIKDLFGGMTNVLVTHSDFSIIELINNCDYIVGYFSTSLLEALYYEKPVFSVKIPAMDKGIFSVIAKDDLLSSGVKVMDDFLSVVKGIKEKKFVPHPELKSYIFNQLSYYKLLQVI